ncbi:MAG: MFS transporter [Acidobacteria bacterium]|nr:MFS transporter [Acidobacteriota bacterium]
MSAPATNASVLLLLLAVSVGVNYIDRGTLAVSMPLISKELDLNPERQGLLLSGFFWSYALGQILSGWVVERYSVRWSFAAGYALWSLATAAAGWSAGFVSLFGTRLALGLGESVAYPAYSRILAAGFPEERRGFANAILDAASKLGPALTILAGGLIVGRTGWRALFIVTGLVSLLWLIPWLYYYRDPAPQSAAQSSISYRTLLGRRQVWATSFAMFCLGYVWYFLVTWLPGYLVRERGLSLSDMALGGTLPFLALAAGSTFWGWLSDRLIRQGRPAARVRRLFAVLGLTLCAAGLAPVYAARTAPQALALISTACLFFGLFTSNVWAITQTLAGPRAAGKWTGIQNCVGNLGGVVAPYLTGVIVQRHGSFQWAFLGAAAVALLGALIHLRAVGPIRPISWETSP